MAISILWLLWALTGGAIATWVMLIIWRPDPPPDIFVRFAGIFVAGVVAGVLGGAVVNNAFVSGDPMPGIVAAGALALIVSGGIAILGGGRRSAAR